MEYTISLALVDFLPVIFSAIGYYLLFRMASHVNEQHGRFAAFGALLIVIGGLSKATWKLIIAASGIDIRWMDNSFFVWMAPGYMFFAWSIWQTARTVQGRKTFHVWLVPAIIAVFTLAGSYYLNISQPDSPAWERVLLSMMVLASISTSILLIIFAFRRKLKLAGWFFIVNLIIILVMNGIARMPEQTIALQWIEESINAISWLCFAFASKKIFEDTRDNFGIK